MKINYTMTVKATILFDGIFEHNLLSDRYFPMETIIANAESHMNYYNFVSAKILDAETGEILVELESDKNDNDDLPDYYDNSDTYNYK